MKGEDEGEVKGRRNSQKGEKEKMRKGADEDSED